jgi:voltage-gated potassium channel
MATRSYSGLLVNFGILCYFLPKGFYHPDFGSFVDAVYFSGVTLATLGYGDISPVHPIARLLSVYEVLASLLLAVLSLALYIMAIGKYPPPGGTSGARTQPKSD